MYKDLSIDIKLRYLNFESFVLKEGSSEFCRDYFRLIFVYVHENLFSVEEWNGYVMLPILISPCYSLACGGR